MPRIYLSWQVRGRVTAWSTTRTFTKDTALPENSMVVAGERHGMCDSVFNTAGERHGMCESVFDMVGERHGMCDSAFMCRYKNSRCRLQCMCVRACASARACVCVGWSEAWLISVVAALCLRYSVCRLSFCLLFSAGVLLC